MNFKSLSAVAFAACLSANAFAASSNYETQYSTSITIKSSVDKSGTKTQLGPDWFIQCHNPFMGGSQEVFQLGKSGNIKCTGLEISGSSGIFTSNHPTLGISKRSNGAGFVINSTGYMGAKPLEIQASEMIINCKVSCKDEFNVTELNTQKIRTNDITVDMNNAADYVFDDNYDLKSLNEVESYVKANKHLPGVPSAAEMAENGMSVAEMSNLLLEKVEELTLHMIELQKENQALKAKMELLEK